MEVLIFPCEASSVNFKRDRKMKNCAWVEKLSGFKLGSAKIFLRKFPSREL